MVVYFYFLGIRNDMNMKRILCECKRCKDGHQWLTSGKPKVCPKCHSPYWNVDRKRKDNVWKEKR